MLLELYWIYAVASWCMSFYVMCSSGEGIRWFLTFQNYLLILGTTSGLACAAVSRIPTVSLLVVFLGWSLYAFLVLSRVWRYQLWRRHLLPVFTPLLVIAAGDIYRNC